LVSEGSSYQIADGYIWFENNDIDDSFRRLLNFQERVFVYDTMDSRFEVIKKIREEPIQKETSSWSRLYTS